MMEFIYAGIIVIFIISLVVYNMWEINKYTKEVSKYKDFWISEQEQKCKLMQSKTKLAEDYNKLLDHCNNQNTVMGVYDKILVQLYKICPTTHIWKINVLEVTEDFIQIEIEYYKRGANLNPKEWSLGRDKKWNEKEDIFIKEFVTMEIPLIKTPLTEKYGKALYEMEVKF